MQRTPSSNKSAGRRRAADARDPRGRGEAGFTLLEAIVAISLLTVGLLGVAGVVSYSMTSTNRSRNVTKAKQVIMSTLEQISILRDTGRVSFEQISNTAQGDFPGFVAEFRQVSNNPGPDGMHGTNDDRTDDTDLSNDSLTRSIVISDLNPTLKRIEVSVEYLSGQTRETLTGVGYINDDSRATFRR